MRAIGSEVDGASIWRARKAISECQLKAILTNPTLEMGPPPPERTPAGRMNAEGIPVFYGALDRETCIAEIRPAVGSYVVTGQFEILRPMRLLDLNLLQEVVIETTYFDPQYADRSNRVAFLKQLTQELTKPVMPEDESREYIATQVIAEYLAHKINPRIDGIFFNSSQTDPPGDNVVLFNHASQVEKIAVQPTANYYVGMPREYDEYDDDEDRVVMIWESDKIDHTDLPNIEGFYDNESDQREDSGRISPDHGPTLKLDISSLVVHEIKAIRPEYTTLQTERRQDDGLMFTF